MIILFKLLKPAWHEVTLEYVELTVPQPAGVSSFRSKLHHQLWLKAVRSWQIISFFILKH